MIGMIAIGAGIIGYWYRKLMWFERIILIGAGLAMIYPETISDIIGLVVLAIMFVIQFIGNKKENEPKAIA